MHLLVSIPIIYRQQGLRLLCSVAAATTTEADYIDTWQASTVKPNSFYEEHAVDKPKKYFYSIDLQGRVFLEETIPKNIATSIKDNAFLDFFFRHLGESRHDDLKFLPPSVRQDYPYVSLCGTERNFVRPADAVIVFHSITKNKNETKNQCMLGYGGTLSQEFHPSQLAISSHTGRLYHELNGNGTRLHKTSSSKKYGLIKSSISVALSNQIVECSSDEDHTSDSTSSSGLCFCNGDDSSLYPIPHLSQEHAPGDWSMPYAEGQS